MRLWKRASGAVKDQNSLWQASLSRRTALRNPDIQKAVIRATTHQDLSLDSRHVDRVCDWVRLSPSNLKPVLWSLSRRLERTRSWPVALKGLHLLHSLLNTNIPSVRRIGRLPFDLSAFSDSSHSRPSKSWPFTSLVRAYFAFLDHKSSVVFHCYITNDGGFSIARELDLLQKLQALVDLLMQIKPQISASASASLVLQVMDTVIIEIYSLYSQICRGIALVLINIYAGGKAEAAVALGIVKKATQQGEDLTFYLEFCHQIGVLNVTEFPVIDRIPDEGIRELEQIINNFDDKLPNVHHQTELIVVREPEEAVTGSSVGGLRTIITDDWEKFDEDLGAAKNPFGTPLVVKQEPPDLITFL
ncbi:ENTH/ANTH/VHS superfamily protein [Striga asiatica]|uniref:ENTH/ANTH/VHS superfamily protein n=1 Tax=Striga asiatica TaxID=4170 RepID=A0A5A7QUW2_STRAF|nr:ENTH/ANTH/VHS superfamily protein [Striga asiatica]